MKWLSAAALLLSLARANGECQDSPDQLACEAAGGCVWLDWIEEGNPPCRNTAPLPPSTRCITQPSRDVCDNWWLCTWDGYSCNYDPSLCTGSPDQATCEGIGTCVWFDWSDEPHCRATAPLPQSGRCATQASKVTCVNWDLCTWDDAGQQCVDVPGTWSPTTNPTTPHPSAAPTPLAGCPSRLTQAHCDQREDCLWLDWVVLDDPRAHKCHRTGELPPQGSCSGQYQMESCIPWSLCEWDGANCSERTPTLSPTTSPTASPSTKPTFEPTTAPTPTPSASPTPLAGCPSRLTQAHCDQREDCLWLDWVVLDDPRAHKCRRTGELPPQGSCSGQYQEEACVPWSLCEWDGTSCVDKGSAPTTSPSTKPTQLQITCGMRLNRAACDQSNACVWLDEENKCHDTGPFPPGGDCPDQGTEETCIGWWLCRWDGSKCVHAQNSAPRRSHHATTLMGILVLALTTK